MKALHLEFNRAGSKNWM